MLQSRPSEWAPGRPRGRILKPMSKSAAPRRHLPSSPFRAPVEPPVRRFDVGDRVSHDQHGLGRVIGVEEEAVLVDFGSVQKRVLSPYGKMSVL
ncbi:conserved hypothetical protein [Streptomyces sp. C]|nr:conserved hypothetical protein [Streptomyces sp. C]